MEKIKVPDVLHLIASEKEFGLLWSQKESAPVIYREKTPYWSKRLLDGERPLHFDLILVACQYQKDPCLLFQFQFIELTTLPEPLIAIGAGALLAQTYVETLKHLKT